MLDITIQVSGIATAGRPARPDKHAPRRTQTAPHTSGYAPNSTSIIIVQRTLPLPSSVRWMSIKLHSSGSRPLGTAAQIRTDQEGSGRYPKVCAPKLAHLQSIPSAVSQPSLHRGTRARLPNPPARLQTKAFSSRCVIT